MSERTMKMLFGLVLPGATLAAVIAPILIWRGDLPDPLAVGWSTGGVADTSASQSSFLAIQTVAAVVAALLFMVAGLRRWKVPIYNAVAAVIAGAIAPTFVLVSVSTVVLNRNATDWATVESPWWGWVVATSLSSLLGIVAIGWLVRDLFRTQTPPLDMQPSAGLSIGESGAAAWHSGASSRWPFLAAAPLIAIGVAIGGRSVLGLTEPGESGTVVSLAIGLALVLIAAIVLAFATILVSVDRRGLTVSYGVLPWPRTRVGLEAIESAHAIDVRPTEHGGWGYRGSRRVFGKAAVVVRGGEGIRLGLKNGNEFVVTVDNASQGAGVLNDLRAAVS